ncbi:hypothetical protein JCM8097_009095 [Rhodosporidiobolus ruineniae]
MPLALPNELILDIFSLAVPTVRRWTIGEHPDHLGARRVLLRSLSLVHRDFTSWAQSELFAYLRVTAPDSTKAFATREKRLRGIKAKGGKVRGLDVFNPSTLGEALKRLTLLSGARNGDVSWIASLPSTLTHLHLQGIGFSNLPAPLPHLTSLYADRVALWELDNPADFLPLFPSLRCLASINCIYISVDVLRRAPPTLQHLLVIPDHWDDIDPDFAAVQCLPHPPKTVTFVVPRRAALLERVEQELSAWCEENEVRARAVRVDKPEDFDFDAWEAAL